jgi:SulP family sulfate permease
MGCAIIGEIPSEFQIYRLEPIQYYTTRSIHLSSAAVLAVLGSIDSLLTSVIADNMTKTRHNSNRELIGQGIGNASCCFWGIPGAGATKVP